MRVIARSTLNHFVLNRVARSHQSLVKAHLDAWYDEVSKALWQNSAELKQQYRSASIVSAERVVFNIKGNDYRLIVRINYDYQILVIVWVGTHREYDGIEVRKVEYDKRRYSGLSNSD